MSENKNIVPTFPMINIQVAPQGILLSFSFSPNATFNIVLDEKTCNDLVKQWVQTRKDIRANGQLADMVRRHPHGN